MLLWASIMASATPFCSAHPLRARAACTARAFSHGRRMLLSSPSHSTHQPPPRPVYPSIPQRAAPEIAPPVFTTTLIPTLTAISNQSRRRRRGGRNRPGTSSSPARMVVDRCQARSVWRSSGVREMVRAVVRPRAIQRPCVREVPPGTPWGPERLRDDGWAGRPRRYRSPRSPRLRRQTVPGSRRRRKEFVPRHNHTVRRALCVSAQHGFVGQVWAGPGVGSALHGIRRAKPEERLQGCRVDHPPGQRNVVIHNE